MGMQVSFKLRELWAAPVSTQLKCEYHEYGGGPEQEQPWIEPYVEIFDHEAGEEIVCSLLGTDNPTVWVDVGCSKTLIDLLIRNRIPFTVA